MGCRVRGLGIADQGVAEGLGGVEGIFKVINPEPGTFYPDFYILT